MARSEYIANESLAYTKAHRAARMHYTPPRSIGPVELTVKILAGVAVLAAIVYLLAQSI